MGFLVPEDFREQIISRLPGLTIIRARATAYPTSRDRISMVKRRGGNSRFIGNVRPTWTDEAPSSAAATETNALYGKVEIPVHTLMLNVPVSRSLLEDSAFPIADVLGEEFTTAIALSEDQAFLTGTGAGQPQGILNGTSANGAPFDSDVALVAGGAASTISSGDAIVKLPFKIDRQYRTDAGSCYMMTKATREAIALLKDGQGIYIFGDRNNPLATAQQDKLRGYDLEESEALPEIAANTFPIVFGNPKRGYTIADRIGMSVERYLDSGTAATDSVVFYVRRRVGGQVTAGWAFSALKVATSV